MEIEPMASQIPVGAPTTKDVGRYSELFLQRIQLYNNRV